MKPPPKRTIIVMVNVLALVVIGVALPKLTVRDKVPVDRVFRTMVLSAAYEHYDNPFERLALRLGKSRIVSAEYLSAEIESFTLFRIPLGCLRGECSARLSVSLTTTGGHSVVDWSTTSCTNESLAKEPSPSVPAEPKQSVTTPPRQSKLEEYAPKMPGHFFDSDTEVSFEYPKDWKIMLEERNAWQILRLRLYGVGGNSIASFAWPPPETGIEEVATVKSANITAKDRSVVREEVFRFCDERNSESDPNGQCSSSGPFIVWANWRNGLFSLGGNWPEGSPEEKGDLADFEKLLATLDIGKQPPSAKTVGYVNKKFGYALRYPATWFNYPAAFSVPPLETEPVPDPEADSIFLGPKALLSNCSVIDPYTPARYINIIERDGSLEDNRAELNKRIAGQDYIESKTQLAGKTVYVYDPRTGSVCPDQVSDQFKIFLFENKGKVFELMTDLYFMPEVRAVISSLHFAD